MIRRPRAFAADTEAIALDVVEKPALRRDVVALPLLVLVLELLVCVLLFAGAVAFDCVPPPEPLPDDPPAVVGEPAATVHDLSASCITFVELVVPGFAPECC